MCGITGVYGYATGGRSVTPAELDAMVAAIAHRGPDDSGTYLNREQRLALGFRRLAIVELTSAGHQPMANDDGTVRIVFNGEIYNHADLRPVLSAKGYKFRGRSDTETLLRLYEAFGVECLRMLEGMFAFAIWDQRLQRLFVARDHVGVKPLYFWSASGEFAFASEIKSLLAYPRVDRDISEEGLSHYLTFLVTPAPQTLFAGISKLPPGHFLTVTPAGPSDPAPYWDPLVAKDTSGRSVDDLADELRHRLDESVQAMLMSDVPYGVFLSGGVDSSANVALMARHAPGRVNTFSVGFRRYEQYNELEHARTVAQRFGTRHREVVIDDHDALDFLPSLVHTQDEPIADWVCVPLAFVARLARDEGVSVVHIGEGADELFGGYPSYFSRIRLERWWPLMRWVPEAVWTGLRSGFGRAAGLGMPVGQRAARLLRYLSDEDGRYWGNAIGFRGATKTKLLNGPHWRDSLGPADSGTVVAEFHRHLAAYDGEVEPLQRISYVELRQRLPELLLMRVDKLTMASSVEARVPFLNHRLVEFAMSLPDAARIGHGTPKMLLKRALSGLVPEEVLRRRKQGFGAPVCEWFRGELSGELRQTLAESAIHERGFFDKEFILGMCDEHIGGVQDLSAQLWTLYNLFHWYDRWLR